MNLDFRTLRADEIDCRVSQINERGLSLLLYKDARCDMNLLDETVGPMNWTRSHSRDNANCIVAIFDEDKVDWIAKEDTGTESNTEAAKGLASDSFKRACVNWGIGRELYTAPFIWVGADKCEIKENGTDRNGKKRFACYDRFQVKSISYNDRREISGLEIINAKTARVVYSYGTAARHETPKEPAPQPKEPATQEIRCADCGRPITKVVWPSGARTSAKKMAEQSAARFGDPLCGTCYTARATNGE